MTKQIHGLTRSFFSLLLIAVLSACGNNGSQLILGHWRAERIRVQSISLPMGPDFVVTAQEIRSLEGEVNIPISSIQSERNAVTLNLPLGVGLSFYFDGADRIYLDMPLAGRVYFERVSDVVQTARVNSNQTPKSVITTSLPTPTPSQPQPTHPSPLPSTEHTRMPAQPEVASANTPSSIDRASTKSSDNGNLIRVAERKISANDFLEAEAILLQARQQYSDDPMVDYNLALLHLRQGDSDSAVRNLRDAFQNGFRDFARLDASTDFNNLKSDPRYNALIARYR